MKQKGKADGDAGKKDSEGSVEINRGRPGSAPAVTRDRKKLEKKGASDENMKKRKKKKLCAR